MSTVQTAARVILGSPSAAILDLTEAQASVRLPLPVSRRIGLVQLAGGSGASATAAGLASALASRRNGISLAVNASGGSAHMLRRLPTGSDGQARDSASLPGTLGEATAGLRFPLAHLAALDLQRPDRPTTAVEAQVWFDRVNPISRFFDLVITDWGVRPAASDLALVGQASHVLGLVCRAERHALEDTAAVIPALRSLPDPPGIVVVSVDVGARGRHDAGREIAAEVGVPLIAVPYDAAWSTSIPTPSRRLSLSSRTASLHLASVIMTEAVASLPSSRNAADPARAEQASGSKRLEVIR